MGSKAENVGEVSTHTKYPRVRAEEPAQMGLAVAGIDAQWRADHRRASHQPAIIAARKVIRGQPAADSEASAGPGQ